MKIENQLCFSLGYLVQSNGIISQFFQVIISFTRLILDSFQQANTYNSRITSVYRSRYLSQNDGLKALCGSFFLLLLLLLARSGPHLGPALGRKIQ